MTLDSVEITVRTAAPSSPTSPPSSNGFCAGRGDGLLHVFVPHATAGVAVMETGSGSEADLADAIDRLLPRADVYRHRHGSTGHGRDHVLPAFVAPSLDGAGARRAAALGTWQSVVLVDSNATTRSGRKLSRTCRTGLSPLLSTSTTLCQVPSAGRPPSTGTASDGETNAGST